MKLKAPARNVPFERKWNVRAFQVSRYVYPPGTVFPDHSHQVDKIDAVISGRFRIRMEEKEVILEVGDIIEVPRGIIHSAEVIGSQPVVSLDGIKKP